MQNWQSSWSKEITAQNLDKSRHSCSVCCPSLQNLDSKEEGLRYVAGIQNEALQEDA